MFGEGLKEINRAPLIRSFCLKASFGAHIHCPYIPSLGWAAQRAIRKSGLQGDFLEKNEKCGRLLK
jgi:hypothetical protein